MSDESSNCFQEEMEYVFSILFSIK